MSIEQFIFRKATIKDTGDIFRLYKFQTKSMDGLARDESEINRKYVEDFTLRSLKSSTQFVVVDSSKDNIIAGEIHCYKLEPKAYNHILSDLTIIIRSEYQGKGLGKKLFETLLSNISHNRADILRVELIVRESNLRAIKFFESVGFKIEGRFEKRIRSTVNQLEADISMAWFNPRFRRIE